MREERIRAKAKKSRIDDRIAAFHIAVSKGKRGDVVRTLAGAGPVAQQSGKWKPYIDGIKGRVTDTIETVASFGQDYTFWLFVVLFSSILYALWTKNTLLSPALGSIEL